MCLSCVSFLPIFPFRSKKFLKKFSSKFPGGQSECARYEEKLFSPCARVKRRDTDRGEIYVRAPTPPSLQHSTESQAAEGKGKEKQHKMLYTIFGDGCARSIRLCTFATLKNAFINIVLRYIAEAGNRYILSRFFFHFFLLLYIVLNDEFLPARVDFFRNIRALASKQRALRCLGIIIFSFFLLLWPRKKIK